MLSVTSSKQDKPHTECNHQISSLQQGLPGVHRDEASMEWECPWWLHHCQMASRPM